MGLCAIAVCPGFVGRRAFVEPRSGGFVTLALRAELVKKIDRFLERNDWGFNSRADFVADAVRRRLEELAEESPLAPEPADKKKATK